MTDQRLSLEVPTHNCMPSCALHVFSDFVLHSYV